MLYLIFFITAVVLIFLGFKFAQLMIFRSAVLNVIVSELKYEPDVPGFQSKAFLDATRLAKMLNGNKYDAAIIFMLSQLATIPTDASTKSFKIEKYALIEELIFSPHRAHS